MTSRPAHSQNTKSTGLKCTMGVNEYLWRFVEKYHTDDIKHIFGRHAKYQVSCAATRCQVEITSTDGKSINSVSKRLDEFCQKLSAQIVDEIVSIPPHISADVVASLIEHRQLVYFVDASNTHHIAGAEKEAKRAKRDLERLLMDDQRATENLRAVGSQPTRSQPFTVDTPNGIRIEIYCGNLVDEQVDALVIPANERLSQVAGAAKAIADAAGSELAEQCKEYIERHGRLKLGEVMHTSAGDMKPRIKYVMHALGPHVVQFQDQRKLFTAVSETFENCLLYANDELKIESVSIPALSAGNLGVPLQLVADAAFDATMKFDNIFGAKDRSLRRIGFVNFDAPTIIAFIKSFSRLEQRPTSGTPSGDPSHGNPTRRKELSPVGGGEIGQPTDRETSVSVKTDVTPDNAQISSNRATQQLTKEQSRTPQNQVTKASLVVVACISASESADVAVGAERLHNPHSQKTEDPGLKCTINVDEYLWKFVEKFHTDDVNDIFGRHSKYQVFLGAARCRVEITSTDETSLKSVSEKLAEFCQKLLTQIADEVVSVPPHVSPDVVKNLIEHRQLVYFVDASNTHHIAGAPKETSRAKRDLERLLTGDQRAMENLRAVGSQPTKSQPFTVDTPNGIRIEIYWGNLVDEQVDALVNPANEWLCHGAGAAKAIADAAGSKLSVESKKYTDRYGQLKVGEVMHTSAGDMQPRIKYVIHALGPRVEKFRDEKKLFAAVSETFENCLRYANNKLKIESVSIPAISSGIFGVSLQLVAAAAFEAAMKFDKTFGDRGGSLRRIGFVNFDARATIAFIESFSRLKQRPASGTPSGDPCDGNRTERTGVTQPVGGGKGQPADSATLASRKTDVTRDNAHITTQSNSRKSDSCQPHPPPEDNRTQQTETRKDSVSQKPTSSVN